MFSNQNYGSYTVITIKLPSHHANVVLLVQNHNIICNAIVRLKRVIKQMWLRVINHPYISTGQPKFHLKGFHQATPSSTLSLSAHTLTKHSRVQATVRPAAFISLISIDTSSHRNKISF